MANNIKFELILCIVNAGFSENVMEAAREAGARGGTILRGRGSANPEAEEFFNITIQPNKEIVLILVHEDLKDVILKAIYHNSGLTTDGQGIAFTLPVERTTLIREDFTNSAEQK